MFVNRYSRRHTPSHTHTCTPTRTRAQALPHTRYSPLPGPSTGWRTPWSWCRAPRRGPGWCARSPGPDSCSPGKRQGPCPPRAAGGRLRGNKLSEEHVRKHRKKAKEFCPLLTLKGPTSRLHDKGECASICLIFRLTTLSSLYWKAASHFGHIARNFNWFYKTSFNESLKCNFFELLMAFSHGGGAMLWYQYVKNIFAPVCHSVHRGGVCLSACWDATDPPCLWVQHLLACWRQFEQNPLGHLHLLRGKGTFNDSLVSWLTKLSGEF